MNRRIAFFAVPVLAFTQLIAEAENSQGEKREHYAATALGIGGAVGGRSLPLDIYIDEYTTDEEVVEYLQVLQESGQDVLRRKLEKIKKGRIAPTGSVGNDIAVIRQRPIEGGKRIILVTARVMPWLENYIGGRTRDYNLSLLVLDLNEEGKGQGTVIVAAKLEFTEDGKLNVESYGQQYVRLANIRRWD